LRELLRATDTDVEIRLRRVPNDAAARRERFLGSPTVRIDGDDVEPGARAVNSCGRCGSQDAPSSVWRTREARRCQPGRLTLLKHVDHPFKAPIAEWHKDQLREPLLAEHYGALPSRHRSLAMVARAA
jgi:hypothetical protein